ncbi:hypothetical protein CC85DRAFT_298772 [Cutaneotrichosporon oleaginosum]|uniref:Uncharacterized protein n=1 Tax=Cutaneotrichosporon oleaginosum TaxID=879819 RepID=A0A0J0XZY6_9TREE|nr:uncharacterized protein CC85DRAFT_298772 [Cutaneotrichosporon oleaginosum]KLT46586.1 hypothetical protein CC85DRAFT_298772 [Cutaneotrichosporon oleaginosum]TXT15049.1 hypothetical protein COLE_01242 [Cutaneotrichosporon oleaginosum]
MAPLRLVAWDDYRRARAHDAHEADVFDESDDDDDDDGADAEADIPVLRAAATPTFKLTSYAPAPARATTADLYRAINVPTFALVRGTRVQGANPSSDEVSSPAPKRKGAVAIRTPAADSSRTSTSKVHKLALPHQSQPKTRTKPKSKSKAKSQPEAKTKRAHSPNSRRAKHTPPEPRRPLAPKVPNAA